MKVKKKKKKKKAVTRSRLPKSVKLGSSSHCFTEDGNEMHEMHQHDYNASVKLMVLVVNVF